MKTKQTILTFALLALVSSIVTAAPLGTAFTYQGKLNDGGQPASGSYDLTFTLFDTNSSGAAIAGPLTNSVAVSNGLFTTTLDFGVGVFTGDARCLEIAVRTNGSTGDFTLLSPRQEIWPVPYALYTPAAGSAGSASNLLGTLPDAQLSTNVARLSASQTFTGANAFNNPANAFTGDGTGLTGLNAENVSSGTLSDARLSANVGKLNANQTFTGANTFNNAASLFTGSGAGLTGLNADNLATGTLPSARLAGTYSSALIFNNAANSITGNGAGLTSLNASSLASGTVPSARLSGTYSSALTFNNAANSFTGSGGGLTTLNASQLTSGTVPAAALGNAWKITGNSGTTPGTHFLGTTDNNALELKVANTRVVRLEPGANAVNVICGYSYNSVLAGVLGATISGGGSSTDPNRVNNSFSTIGGGLGNTVSGQNSTVSGGAANTIQTDADDCVVGGGFNNSIQSSSDWSTIGGGWGNVVQGSTYAATIAGGYGCVVHSSAADSTIGGGAYNEIQSGAQYATIPGGNNNSASGSYSFAAGQRAKANHQGVFVWADSTGGDFASTANNQFLIRAAGGVGIGTASPDSMLQVKNIGDNGGTIRVGANATTLVDKKILFGDGDFVTIGETAAADDVMLINASRVGISRTATANKLEVEGNASKTASGSWLANSDARIKHDIQPITGALDTLAQVRLVQFRYTDKYRQQHPSIEDRPYVNVVAQEFQKVFPESVKESGEKLENGEGILQVDTYPLTIYAAAAVQELNRQLKAKDARITELEERLERVERLLNHRAAN